MASNHTTNFNLSQWEENDEVLRADFNADNLKLDAALSAAEAGIAAAAAEAEQMLNTAVAGVEQQLDTAVAQLNAAKADKAGLVQYAAGSYTGNDSPDGQVISLGFTPEAVIVWHEGGSTSDTYGSSIQIHGCMAIAGGASKRGTRMLLEVTDGGFRAYRDGVHIGPNDGNKIYFYLAFHR